MKTTSVNMLGTAKTQGLLVKGMLTKLDKKVPTRLGCTTCTAMSGNGATIIMEKVTTSRRPQRTLKAQRGAFGIFFAVGRGSTSRVALVPLSAVPTARV